MVPHAWLLLHVGATLAMTGLIWFVQLVHYPLFQFAANGDFPAFADAHQRRTTWIVLPLMTLELASATAIVVLAPPTLAAVAWLGAGLLAAIWAMTGLVQVPLHRRLAAGFDSQAARRLVATNWGRTMAWTARAVLAVWLLAL